MEVFCMTETVLNTAALPEALIGMISAEKILLKEIDGEIHLIPLGEPEGTTRLPRGCLSAYPELSVSSFLSRKHAEKELDL
jgi:hypothetical protein